MEYGQEQLRPEEVLVFKCKVSIRFFDEARDFAAHEGPQRGKIYLKDDIMNGVPVERILFRPSQQGIGRGINPAREVYGYVPKHSKGDELGIVWFVDRQPEGQGNIDTAFEITRTSFGPEGTTESDLFFNEIDEPEDLAIPPEQAEQLRAESARTQLRALDSWMRFIRDNFELSPQATPIS